MAAPARRKSKAASPKAAPRKKKAAVKAKPKPKVPADELLGFYRQMLLIRRF